MLTGHKKRHRAGAVLQGFSVQNKGLMAHGAGQAFRLQMYGKSLALALGSVAALAIAGCGQQYRPVVSAISPVGPAAQPTKYAIAVSNPSSIPLQAAATGYSITNNVITVNVAAPNPFLPGETVTLSGLPTSTFLNGQTLTILTAGFSTTQFSANLTNANVAATTEAGTISLPGALQPGLLTFVDVSGDTILSTPSVLPFPAPTSAGTATVAPTPTFINPLKFSLTFNGSQGFLVNNSGNFESFFTTNPPALLTQDITPQALSANAIPNSVQAFNLPSTGQTLFIAQPNISNISELQASGSSASLLQNLSVTNPVYIVGVDGAARVYAIDAGNGVANGQVYPIENNPVSLLTPIPVGANPVYGVMTTDGNRAFVLNKGAGTVTVLNVPSNALDATTPTITLPGIVSGGVTTAANPVWADLTPATNAEIVVLNQGDGVHQGSLTIISIPLCNASSPVTNPNCSTTNPVDAAGFGTIVKTVNVGINPSMVSVLQDGTRAYVVNSGILPGVNTAFPAGIEGSVSVVNLLAGTVTATIPAISTPAGTATVTASPALVYGHPNTVAAVTGTPTGKVYVTSSDNKYMTVIETDNDSVDTHISLQGLGIRVLSNVK
jgi:hypothetical protein